MANVEETRNALIILIEKCLGNAHFQDQTCYGKIT